MGSHKKPSIRGMKGRENEKFRGFLAGVLRRKEKS
jgi:hypothetical protein